MIEATRSAVGASSSPRSSRLRPPSRARSWRTAQLARVIEQLEERFLKAAELLEAAGPDITAFS
jgi:hypothetical protein